MGSRSTATEPLLTVKQLAVMLHVEPQTIHYWRHKGTGPRGIKLNGGKILFRRSDVDIWLDERAERTQTA